ncbi:MAG: FtsX-like permease family protein [Mycobacteriales bacterium]
MLWTALQGLVAHRFRLFATALAVTLGVAFTAGTLVLTDTVTRTFDGLFGDVYKGTDVVVRGAEQFAGPGGSGAQRARVPASLLETVRRVDGVKAADGGVLGYARLVDKHGKAIGNPTNGAPTLGYGWSTVSALNPFPLRSGRAPQAPDEVVIDAKSARDAHFHLGDRTTVLVQGPPQSVRIVGIAGFGSADSPGGASVVAFRTDVAQRLIAEPGKYDDISAVADSGVSQKELTKRVAAVLPKGTEAVTGAAVTKESQDLAHQSLSFFTTFMLVFAVVALLVGAFMIFNTFSITVAQRTRENGLLRALGASRRQVLSAVLLEALAVGIIASVLGLASGIAVAAGLKSLLDALGLSIPAGSLVVGTRTVVLSLVAGIGVTLFAALSPARKAAKVSPVAAMQAHIIGSTGYGSKERVAVGVTVLAAGTGALFTGLFADIANRVLVVGIGALLVFFGVSVLGRTISLPLSRAIGAPLPRARGVTGDLARENAMRNPKRTAASASALMIGVGLVGFITIFVASSKASVNAVIDRAFTGDLVVDSGAGQGQGLDGGIDPALAQRLNALPEVAAASGVRVGAAQVDGKVVQLAAVDPATGFQVMDVRPLQGSPSGLVAVNAIAVHKDTAKDKGLKIGDTVPVRFRDTGVRQLRVALIYGERSPAGDWFLGKAAYEANFANRLDVQVYVKKAPGTSVAQARAAVERVTAAYPGVKIMDEKEFGKSISAPLDQMLALVYALLGLAIIIALLGIGNTLALSIMERTRELGLLRAVGMTRRQLRSMVRWESVIIAVQGTLLGLLIGVFLGWALVRALHDQGVEVFSLPTASLAVVIVLGALAGMVAAVLPSRRAARLDVLRAVATE